MNKYCPACEMRHDVNDDCQSIESLNTRLAEALAAKERLIEEVKERDRLAAEVERLKIERSQLGLMVRWLMARFNAPSAKGLTRPRQVLQAWRKRRATSSGTPGAP